MIRQYVVFNSKKTSRITSRVATNFQRGVEMIYRDNVVQILVGNNMECHASRLARFSCPPGPHVPITMNMCNWIVQWVSFGDVFAFQLFCTLLRKILEARNKLIFEQKEFMLLDIAAAATKFICDFKEANKISISPTITTTTATWRGPTVRELDKD